MKKIALIAAALMAAGVAQAQTGSSPFYGEAGIVALKFDAGNSKANTGALRGFAGWDAHPNIGLELMLATGTSDDTFENSDVKIKLKNAYGLFVKPKFALSNQFEVFGRIGWAKAKIKQSYLNASVESDGDDLAWGLGATYKFSKHWYGSVDYTNYYDKNSEKIDGFGVNVGYRF